MLCLKETQIKNDEDSNVMRALSAPVLLERRPRLHSVVRVRQDDAGQHPGQSADDSGLDAIVRQCRRRPRHGRGSISAHGSIVAREYGIPAVLGVGNGTRRIRHGQTITIDGDAGTVLIHDEDS